MTTHPDTPDPRAGVSPTPEPMGDERLAECLAYVVDTSTRYGAPIGDVLAALDDLYDECTRQRAVIAERDAEIERLTTAIRSVVDREDLSWVEVEAALISALMGGVVDETWQMLDKSALETLMERFRGEELSDER